jgi:hypothetical protein
LLILRTWIAVDGDFVNGRGVGAETVFDASKVPSLSCFIVVLTEFKYWVRSAKHPFEKFATVRAAL